jgi:hypothetical protein
VANDAWLKLLGEGGVEDSVEVEAYDVGPYS